MAKRKRPQNVIAFPKNRIVRATVPCESAPECIEPAPSIAQQLRMDRMAELIAERAKRTIQKWQAAEGMPDEITMLVDRITEIAGFSDGLPAVEVARLYECLPPREEATEGLDSESLRLLEQLDARSQDPDSAFSRALAKRAARKEVPNG